ncbi:MAG: diguanylate cyclase (GGDEF)-like protein/PAS domain S-box-containing protein [Oleiphilaceae bacterium]|jgi:diguanylate cyclase (GGDEF)-like protein/PAS domain S-box-containing protein
MLPLRKRLSYQQAKWALMLVLFLGIIVSGVQIVMDWQYEHKSVDTRVEKIMNTLKDPAIQAAYSLDKQLAAQVISGLMIDDAIFEAELQDDLGGVIARQRLEPSNDDLSWLTELLVGRVIFFTTSLHVDPDLRVGQINVWVDGAIITSDFVSRSIRVLLFGLARNLILGVALLGLFYTLTSRPLAQITSQLKRLDHQARKSKALTYIDGHQEDELGILVETFNEVWASRDQTEALLAEKEAYFRAVMEQSGEALILADLEGHIIDVNAEACRSMAYDNDELINLTIADIDANASQGAVVTWMQALKEGVPVSIDSRFRRKDSLVYPVEIRCNLLTLNGEKCLLASIRDVSERKKAEEKVHYLAYYDDLTKLPNRRLLQNRLELTLSAARRHQHIGALLFLDLDRFKMVNDSLGHTAGDELLSLAAMRIKGCLREEDTAARIGGDEFVILVPELSDDLSIAQNLVRQLAQRILVEFSLPFSIREQDVYMTVSVGISLFPFDDVTSSDILQQADTAMYRTKAEGRNGYYFYHAEMQKHANERLILEKALHLAIENEELSLQYQPQVNEQGQLSGFEALVRWNHPTLGRVPPERFIHIAEETGLILPIGRWILVEACHQLLILQAKGLPKTFKRLAINISPRQFADDGFVDEIRDVLRLTGADASFLELELTEGMLVKNIDAVILKMKILKNLGFSFSIDDFGTGYSSLRYLKHLPIDLLKVDQSFVRDIIWDANSRAIVHTIIAMANHLDLALIAEGVETDVERKILFELGCKNYQGYYFSRPVGVDRLVSYIEKDVEFPKLPIASSH